MYMTLTLRVILLHLFYSLHQQYCIHCAASLHQCLQVEDVEQLGLRVGDAISVVVLGKDDKGRYKLSRKALLEQDAG